MYLQYGKVARQEEKNLVVQIKPGWKEGTKITYPEEGDFKPSVKAADIEFTIVQKQHPVFTRIGNDLVTTKFIGLKEALTGFQFKVESISRETIFVDLTNVVLKPDNEHRISMQGMPCQKDPMEMKKGDLLVRFEIKFPDCLSEQQKQILFDVL